MYRLIISFDEINGVHFLEMFGTDSIVQETNLITNYGYIFLLKVIQFYFRYGITKK